MTRGIRTLLFSSLYPSSVRPGHGIFVETRLRELLGSGAVESRVLAPVPWFFSTDARYGAYALLARTPRHEVHNGIEVQHPRYLLPPKVGMTIAPLCMALASAPYVKQLIRDGFDFDLIDAHYFYPDGVAAALLATWFRKPFVVTARGSDLNLIAGYRVPRSLIRWAARRSQGSIGVSQRLVDVLSELGVPPQNRHMLRNGVDLKRFRPLPCEPVRRELGLGGAPVLISVGHLIEIKGHHLAIDALAQLLPDWPGARLVVVGDGPQRSALVAQAVRLGLQNQVHFAGAVANTELLRWYSAADVLILASSREGWANVLLEAMACGTPVVATDVGAAAEVITSDAVGRLVVERDAPHIAGAVASLLRAGPQRAGVRAHAEGFSWLATTEAQLGLFKRIVATTAGQGAAA